MKRIQRISQYATAVMGVVAAGLIGSLATPVHAQESLGNEVLRFSEDTTIEFEFRRTNGANRSTLGIRNADTGEETVLFQEVTPFDGYVPGQALTSSANDFIGTVEGGTVRNGSGQASRFSEFTFRANNRYVFFLDSVSPSGQTTRSFDSTQISAAKFNGSLNGGAMSDAVGVRIAWDDDGLPTENKDFDDDDFVIEAGGYLIEVTCPPIR